MDIITYSRQYFQAKLKQTGYFQDHADKLEVEAKRLIFRVGESFQNSYEIGLKVGDPQYSKAYNATHRVTGDQKAVKIIKKSTIKDIEEFV